MEKFKYIIIDDEQPTHIMVQYHFRGYQEYSFEASFYDPEMALIFLQENDVDLIFLDIRMPKMNGFQFLEKLNKEVFVVILTAYPDKYSLDAHNYIDKDLVFFSDKAQFPYYFSKILKRFEKMYEEKSMIDRIYQLSKNEIYTFPKTYHKESIPLKDILFFTIVEHNIVLQLKNGQEEICRMSLKQLMEILPAEGFLQIDRHIVINTMYITAYTSTTVCVEEYHFSISARRREEVLAFLQAQKEKLPK